MDGRRQRWSVSGLASAFAHAALVAASLSWNLPHAGGRSAAVELDVRSTPPPVTVAHQAQPARAPPAARRPRAGRQARRDRRPPVAVPVPVAYEDPSLIAPPAQARDGDEDRALDSPSPSTLAGRAGAPAGTDPVRSPAIERSITPLEASHLCIHQSLRSLPRPLYVRGRSYKVEVQMCITAQGRVGQVILQKGADPLLDGQVVTDLQSWLYRPRVVGGQATAFCYRLNVIYQVD
jgi:hypothetical protein